jgi:putative CocE/NonD family hydrolase
VELPPIQEEGLTFHSDALDEELELAGAPMLEIAVATPSQFPADFCAGLVDVHPDGRALWVADGVTRLDAASSSATASTLRIDLGDQVHRFPAGHRIRLDIASSNFPQFDCVGSSEERELLHGQGLRPRLILPVRSVD